MLRLNRNAIMIGVVILALFAAGAVDAKPWRNIDSILASRIRWMGLSGTDGADKTHLYSIKAQGSIFKPYPKQPPYPANVQAYVETWLSKHPKARVIPVEAYPFLSVSVARVYVWIVDGDENLNLRLVAEGFFRGSTQVPMLRTADLLVSAHEARAFRKKLAAAEVAAATAGKGIWKQKDREPGVPPGKLVFPGIRALAEFERMAENAPKPKPPLTYGPDVPEADLLDIFSGDDGPAAYAARSELLRRAESGELSRMAFSSLIAKGLDQQLLEYWQPFYGSLIQLAFQHGKLSDALLKQYARQAISLQFLVKTRLLEPNTPWVNFTIKRKGRFARTRTPKVIAKRQTSELLITTAFHIDQMKVDGEPALNGRTGKILSETWLYQAWRGNKVQPVSIMTDPPVEPGPHTLTGVLTVRYLTGVAAWNAAGQRKPLPDGVPTLLEERFDIDLEFTMADY
jgi:hypothetical protein